MKQNSTRNEQKTVSIGIPTIIPNSCVEERKLSLTALSREQFIIVGLSDQNGWAWKASAQEEMDEM